MPYTSPSWARLPNNLWFFKLKVWVLTPVKNIISMFSFVSDLILTSLGQYGRLKRIFAVFGYFGFNLSYAFHVLLQPTIVHGWMNTISSTHIRECFLFE
ncbi:hypothetical protein KsCSTR_34470 [Candidatus Kuenenia stuttgartiensis]|uniref:Uncharacterized protein n=1 Tax=Kuenenia stuttgartiensis TaxID=174633 RepID=Q1Q452_KUEST|nr:hypothetical protein KsCSTR_34470 [Candidatus Kuenenia stuttgartiensis]CAJ74796.1 unknown protein [Candidatus Kuenenia stuttgartiensis]